MLPKKRIMTVLASALLLVGCSATTTDPSKGGLFSYSPEAYEARIKEREARLAAIEAQQAKEREESEALKKAVGERVVTVAAQQGQLREMQSNIESLKTRLAQSKTADTAQAAKITALETRATDIEKQMRTNTATQNVEERKAYLEKLKQEYDSLQKDMDALLME